jgi:hypothetical protein
MLQRILRLLAAAPLMIAPEFAVTVITASPTSPTAATPGGARCPRAPRVRTFGSFRSLPPAIPASALSSPSTASSDRRTRVGFSYAELNRCNSDWSGGAVSASQARFNALVNMWKLLAMRHALGEAPLNVSSGFRSHACNNAVSDLLTSRHLYGDAVDLVGSHSLCRLRPAGPQPRLARDPRPPLPGSRRPHPRRTQVEPVLVCQLVRLSENLSTLSVVTSVTRHDLPQRSVPAPVSDPVWSGTWTMSKGALR